MKYRTLIAIFAILLPLQSYAGVGGGTDEPMVVNPDGMFVLTPVQEQSCIAIKVSLAADQALSGVRWFNNDDQTIFPNVLVASGYTSHPPLFDDGVVVASNVFGAEVAWSEIQFSEPMASETGTLYVIFQLPAHEEGQQMGIGPAIGYVSSEEQSCVFVSTDGDDWSRLITDYQLLVDPVYSYREPGTAALSCSRPHPESMVGVFEEPDTPVVDYRTELLNPYPNPFNPTTSIAFTLKDAGSAELSVFDVRGRRVAELHTGHLEQGRHEFQWHGKNAQGGRVSSGVYFARLKIAGDLMVQRMMLIK